MAQKSIKTGVSDCNTSFSNDASSTMMISSAPDALVMIFTLFVLLFAAAALNPLFALETEDLPPNR